MDLSVVIPVYNSRATIVGCLDSVVAECSANPLKWELIVVDDGSKDDSAEIVSRYIASSPHGGNIRLIRQPNGGVAAARNTGMKAAKGALVAFNDSDDRWLPGRVAIQTRYFADHPEVDLVGGIYGEKRSEGVSLLKLDHETPIDIDAQVLKNYFSPPTVMFRARVLEKTGYFNEKMRYAEDADFFYRVVSHFRAVFIAERFAAPLFAKMPWGESGLSANLAAMERGELTGIARVYRGGFISWPRFAFACAYSVVKFVRRCVISTTRKFTSKFR